MVHSDDFTFTGYDEDLTWVEIAMGKAFLCKVGGAWGTVRATSRRSGS